MNEEKLISVADLKQLLDQKEDIQLIDVRTQEKHDVFNIGGQLIPIDQLPSRLTELQKHKMTVTYCTSGGKSMHALNYLVSQGFENVKSLDGGMTEWRTKFE